MTLLVILVSGAAAILAIPALIFFVECFGSLFLPAGKPVARPGGVSVVVLVPAHDEKDGIQPTIAGVQSQLAVGDRVLVVADNCTDDTAELARVSGAEVLERSDPERRGKGYALAFGIDHLEAHHPDVLIIVDADCHLTPGSIDALVQRTVQTQRPVQADYVFHATERAPVSMISALATLVRNRVRPRGLRRLGQPCHLTGTGMAFPWSVLRAAPELGANIVEDLAMGIELALLGHEPVLCIEAGVRSELPTGGHAAMQQRRRWEHGHISTILQHGPRLVREGIRRGRPGLIALGADLIVPPLALLVGQLVLVLGISGLLILFGGPTFPAWIAGAALALVGLGVALGWTCYGRKTIPFWYLLLAPLYVAWKIPLYGSFLFGRREQQWLRTER
ncbi:MAG: glycosyl transferase [Deltaproteobacteria bacterium]|nr:MAG: glycosyl transferase [Deltaproteobacteria bacterium]